MVAFYGCIFISLKTTLLYSKGANQSIYSVFCWLEALFSQAEHVKLNLFCCYTLKLEDTRDLKIDVFWYLIPEYKIECYFNPNLIHSQWK